MRSTVPGLSSTCYVLALVCMMASACSGSKEAGEREPFIIEPDPPNAARGMRLAVSDSSVKSIQLYRTGRGQRIDEENTASVEVQFPSLAVGSSEQLVLEFDVLIPTGKPLSVYFYHADASWQRDLTPPEYLGGFQRDELLNYTSSRATEIPYTHYTYAFPNDRISFTVSGNYILRITEQGQENEVLFEHPFFISEQRAALQMGIENVLPGSRGFSSVQPVAWFIPPNDLQANIYDFDVCFVRNGDFAAPRCTNTPHLIQAPALRFYLEPSQAFEPIMADYFLDLSYLRAGPGISHVDFTVVPNLVSLEPDYARFAGDPLDPVLYGQSIISGVVRDVFNPDIAAQYVNVRFSYVPADSRPIAGNVLVRGSFSRWRSEPEHFLTWSSDTQRYEGEVLIKQGQYDYRYVLGDEDLPRGTVPRQDNLYVAMVYYRDIRINTDRLIAMGAFTAL